MAYPAYIREKAIWMRTERRMTLDEISERLAIPKTTVWYWINHIELDPPISKRSSPGRAAARRKGSQSMQNKYKALRDAAYERGRKEYEQLIQKPGFRDFICMYVGEGYKRSRNTVSIANSDVRVLKLAAHWMGLLTEKRLIYSLQFHADQDLAELRAFWGAELGIEPEVIRLQRKSNSNQLKGRTWRSQWGVMSVTAHDTYLRSRLQAWIDRVQESWLDSAA